jgi:hypothetical protein
VGDGVVILGADVPRPIFVRRVRAVLALLVGAAAVVGLASPSSASSDEWRITRYDADVTVAADGVADVRVDFDFDFGDEPGHGPFVTLPTRQAIEGDDEQDRLFRITDITAASDTAPDDLEVDSGRSSVVLRIGDEDIDDVVGVHTYTVTYRVDGWVNPAGTTLGSGVPPTGDELFLNVLGTDWEVPLEDISATVTGPADVDEAQCFEVDADSGGPCATQEIDLDGPTAAFALDRAFPVSRSRSSWSGRPGRSRVPRRSSARSSTCSTRSVRRG